MPARKKVQTEKKAEEAWGKRPFFRGQEGSKQWMGKELGEELSENRVGQ